MGLFGGGNRDEHHGDGCRDRTGAWWAKPNPMGVGSNASRTVKRPGASASSQNSRPTSHGSKAERELLAGKGRAINWGLGPKLRVDVTGEKPPGRRR